MTTQIVGHQKHNHLSRKEKLWGQFWTPQEVVHFIIDFIILNSKTKGPAIDPACGDGAFLKGLVTYGIHEVTGVDIDKTVISSLDKSISDSVIIRNENTLLSNWENKFNIVIGNPPFSAKYGRVHDSNILSRFELGKNRQSQAIEILFLEKFIRLARPDGVIGIVLPYGIIANKNLDFVRNYLLKTTQVLGVISLPRFIFNGRLNTSSKTCILLLKKTSDKHKKVFMSMVNNLHELVELPRLYTQQQEKQSLAFWVSQINGNLSPEFYNPELNKIKESLLKTRFPVEKLENLIDEMFCGRTEYGAKRVFSSRGIPFISAKVVTNLGLDFIRSPKLIGPDSVMFKEKVYSKVGDLLFVRVGAGCAGRTAVINSEQERGVVDDWIYIIRTQNKETAYFLTFYLHTKFGEIQINGIKRGVGTVTIPQSLLKEVLVPILPQQSKFKKLYEDMVSQRRKGNIKKAENIFSNTINSIEQAIDNSN